MDYQRNKQFAEQAGLYYEDSISDINYDIAIQEFAELIRADEREACAKLCDELSNEVGNKNFIAVDQRQFCAKQIRARDKQ
jgi:hypothetical protein